jgi:hypothetical protein
MAMKALLSPVVFGVGVALAIGVAPPLVFAQLHTRHDHIPDLCASPTVRSVKSGPWSDPSTWSTGRAPASPDRVRIAKGTAVDFDVVMPAAVDCVGVEGRLALATARTTRLWAGNILVYERGELTAGTVAAPIAAEAKAEIVVANRPLDPARDPDQYGTALIVLGTLRMHGATKSPTWTRVAAEPQRGATTLELSQPVDGWLPGDRLVLPDTRHMRSADVRSWAPTEPQWEELTVSAVSPDRRTITVTPALKFDHPGARDGDGRLDFLPHVGNLSRNVVVRSEVAIDTPGATLGHTMLTARADVDVRYVHFKDLGRTTIDKLDNATNHIGRYAVHAHHLMGPTRTPANGHQFTLIGNAIDGSTAEHRLKWGLAIHDSHYGLIQGNVVYNWAGSAVMFEDGSESFNVLDGNFAVRSRGEGDRMAIGTEGGGFWFKGPNNYVRNNVAADLWGNQPEGAYGYKFFFHYLGNIRVPKFKGADTGASGQHVEMDGNKMPILEFTNNETYGAAHGLTYWWVNAFGAPDRDFAATETVFRDTRIWHVFNVAIYHYPSDRITFDGLTIRGGQPPGVTACCSVGHYGGDYGMKDLVIRRADIQGMGRGIDVSMLAVGPMRIEDSVFRNDYDIVTSAMWNVGSGQRVVPRDVTVRNSRFSAMPGRRHQALVRNWDLNARPPMHYNLPVADVFKVYGYQGDPSDNFQVFYGEQATTNVAGGTAPCTTRRAEVEGLVCPIPPGERSQR